MVVAERNVMFSNKAPGYQAVHSTMNAEFKNLKAFYTCNFLLWTIVNEWTVRIALMHK